jgi:hypothetical protein
MASSAPKRLRAGAAAAASATTRYWLGTVSKTHVESGKRESICQVCHGKEAALARMAPGDYLVYYSSKLDMGGAEPYQCFTAVARIADDHVYPFEVTKDFVPFRRRVEYLPNAADAPIRALIPDLDFIKNKSSWGMSLRNGLIQISKADFDLIARAMKVHVE